MIDVKGKRVFLSGPMTGVPLFNAAAFGEAHMRLLMAGAERVYDPMHEFLDRYPMEGERSHETYMRRCIGELARGNTFSGPYYDLVVQLDGWEASDGACMEYQVANACGIPCASARELADG